jgi:hypothetical protein
MPTSMSFLCRLEAKVLLIKVWVLQGRRGSIISGHLEMGPWMEIQELEGINTPQL